MLDILSLYARITCLQFYFPRVWYYGIECSFTEQTAGLNLVELNEFLSSLEPEIRA